jgi:hypothetical protein
MLSAADITLFGFHFTGIIGIVLLNEREYRIEYNYHYIALLKFSTYYDTIYLLDYIH